MSPSGSRANWSLELPLLLAIFLDLVGFSMLIPDMQTRLEAFGASGVVIGAVLSVYFVVQILVSPLWGKVSDRIGRKPVLVISGALSCASLVMYAFADTTSWILVSRVLAGFAAANVVVAQAYIADITTEERRMTAMGRVGGSTMAGTIVGPAVGGILAALGGNYLLGLVAATAAGLGAMWILLAVPHRPPTATGRPWGRVFLDFSLLKEVPAVRPLMLLGATAWFSLACLEGTFGRLLKAIWGYGEMEFGWIFSYESLLGVIVQAVLLGWLAARMAPRALLRLGYLLQGIGLAVTPLAPNLLALFGASTLYAFGGGVASPTLATLSSQVTPEHRQGEMFGLFQSARSFGFIFGPILGGRLFDTLPAAPYWLAGFVAIVVGLSVSVATGAPTHPRGND